jgi:hypothetical protein
MRIRADVIIVDNWFINKHQAKIIGYDLEILHEGQSDFYIDDSVEICYISDKFVRILGILDQKFVNGDRRVIPNMLAPVVIESVAKLKQSYENMIKKYDYCQINEYFCRLPKDNMIYINDIKLYKRRKKYRKYIRKWFLLYFFNDIRYQIMYYIVTLNRLDYMTYRIFN